MDNRKLLDALRDGLPLAPRPFELIGRACGASEDDVLACLRRLHGNGTLTQLAPLPSTGSRTPDAPAPDSFDERLLELVASGFPLLSHPYEAIAAILGATEGDVLDRLGALVDAGLIGRIGMQPHATGPQRTIGSNPSPNPG